MSDLCRFELACDPRTGTSRAGMPRPSQSSLSAGSFSLSTDLCGLDYYRATAISLHHKQSKKQTFHYPEKIMPQKIQLFEPRNHHHRSPWRQAIQTANRLANSHPMQHSPLPDTSPWLNACASISGYRWVAIMQVVSGSPDRGIKGFIVGVPGGLDWLREIGWYQNHDAVTHLPEYQ